MGKKTDNFWTSLRRKLCSRKFWISVSAFVTGVILIRGGTEEYAQSISGAIMAGAAVFAYCIGEGLADNDNKK